MLLIRCSGSLGLVLAALASHGQAPAARPSHSGQQFYVVLEGSLFANRRTQLTQPIEFVTAERSNLVVAPALLVGYQLRARWAVEVRVEDLPVLAGFQYERATPTSYLGFGQRYTQDYLYVPVRGAWRALGQQSRLSLSLLAGGGPAWTDTTESLITPNGTQVYYEDGNSIGSGPTAPPGATVRATVTQQLTQQRGLLLLLEAGVRGTWHVRPRLALDLTVRQLWGLTASARDLDLTIDTDGNRFATTLRAPVRGVCTGLGLRYGL